MHEDNVKSEAELWELSVGEDAFTRAEAIQELGVRCLKKGQHDEGLNFMNAALDIWREQDDLLGIGRSCYSQGTFHLAHDKYEVAVPLLEEAVFSYHNAFHTIWEADALRALGSAYMSLGLVGIAQDMFIRASACYEEMDEYYRASLSEIDLGNTYAGLFEIHLALNAFQRSLNFAQKSEDPFIVLRSNSRIASMHFALGDVEVSLEISRNSVLTAQYLENDELVNLVKDDLTETLVDLGMFEEALPLLEETSAYWKAQGSLSQALSADTNRVSTLFGLGRIDAAKQLLTQVAATSQSLAAKSSMINVALVQGDIQAAEGAHEAALESYLTATVLAAEAGDEAWLERYSWLQVAEVLLAMGNFSEAQEILDELSPQAWGDCVRERTRHEKLIARVEF